MKRITQLILFLFLSIIGHVHAQNISTGITNAGAALPTGIVDPNWHITAGPNGPENAINSIAAFPWQTIPVSGSNAGWINAEGTPCDNLYGTYTFERSFTISSSVANLTATLSAAYDDSLVSLALIDPNGISIPLTVTPTSTYNLSLPVSYTQNSPTAGTWRIQAVLYMVNDGETVCGAFMLAGEITTSCTPLCNCDALNPDFETQLDICDGTFTSTSDIPPCIKEAGTDSYEWTIDGNYAGSTSTLNYTFPSNGTYNVCLKISATLPDGTECFKEFCKDIEITACTGCVCDSVIPNIDYNVDKCSGVFSGTTILPSCLNGTQASYNWYVNGNHVGSGSPFNYFFPGNGIYTVCLKVGVTLPDGTKCSQDTCVQILVNNCGECHCNQVQPDFNYTVTDCSVNLVNTTTGPDCVQRTYKWFVGSVLVGTGNTFNYTFPGSGTYTVCMKVVGVMPGGVPCKPFICKQITVNCDGCCDSLIPSITYNVDKCSAILNGHAIVPACLSGASVSYSWTINSANAGSGATLIHPFPGNGFYTVCLYATIILADGTKCTQDTCIEVIVNNCDECKCNQVQPDFTYSVNNCVVNFVNATTGPDCVQRTYKWFVDSVLVGTGSTFNYTFPGSGTYTVCMKVVGSMPGGIPCKPFICKQITVDCGPCTCNSIQPILDLSSAFCNGTFNGSLSNVPGCLQNVVYRWYVGVTGSGTVSPVGTGVTYNHTFGGSGAYTICLMISGNLPDGTYCEKMECQDIQILCLTVEPPIGGGPNHPFPHGRSVNLYPNPANDHVTIEMELEEDTEVQLIMKSSDGKELINEKRDGKAGLQRFDLKIPESIANSMVFIEISTNQEKITRMVNILK